MNDHRLRNVSEITVITWSAGFKRFVAKLTVILIAKNSQKDISSIFELKYILTPWFWNVETECVVKEINFCVKYITADIIRKCRIEFMKFNIKQIYSKKF